MPRRRSVNAVHTNMNEYGTLIQHYCLWAIDNPKFFVSTLSKFSSLIFSFRYSRLHCNNPPSANLWAESLWVHTDGKEAAERSGLSAQDLQSRNQKDKGDRDNRKAKLLIFEVFLLNHGLEPKWKWTGGSPSGPNYLNFPKAISQSHPPSQPQKLTTLSPSFKGIDFRIHFSIDILPFRGGYQPAQSVNSYIQPMWFFMNWVKLIN